MARWYPSAIDGAPRTAIFSTAYPDGTSSALRYRKQVAYCVSSSTRVRNAMAFGSNDRGRPGALSRTIAGRSVDWVLRRSMIRSNLSQSPESLFELGCDYTQPPRCLQALIIKLLSWHPNPVMVL